MLRGISGEWSSKAGANIPPNGAIYGIKKGGTSGDSAAPYYERLGFDASAGTIEDNPMVGHVGPEIKPTSISFLYLIAY